MTADSPAQTTREPVPGRRDRAELGLPAPTILSMCDHLLGEAGRRHHMFTWLRAPGAGAGEWLAVDAYYPRSRLVVMCRSRPGPHDALYRELVPAHGLGLLTLDPTVLGNDREAVRRTLAAKFVDFEQVPRTGRTAETASKTAETASRTAKTASRTAETASRTAETASRTAETASRTAETDRPARRDDRPARRERARETAAHASADAADDPAPEWTPVRVERTSVPRGFVQALGVLAGLAFAALLIAELYLGVIKVAFGDGRLALGLAILLEVLSRTLGTVAAEGAGRRGWACACAILGAPVVAWAALAPRSGRIEDEPAPLAGRLAVLAGVIALAGVITGT